MTFKSAPSALEVMAPSKRPTPDDDEDDTESEVSEVIGVESAQSNLRRDPVSPAIGVENSSLTEDSGRKPGCPTKAPAMQQVKQALKMTPYSRNKKRSSGRNSRAIINCPMPLRTMAS